MFETSPLVAEKDDLDGLFHFNFICFCPGTGEIIAIYSPKSRQSCSVMKGAGSRKLCPKKTRKDRSCLVLVGHFTSRPTSLARRDFLRWFVGFICWLNRVVSGFNEQFILLSL